MRKGLIEWFWDEYLTETHDRIFVCFVVWVVGLIPFLFWGMSTNQPIIMIRYILFSLGVLIGIIGVWLVYAIRRRVNEWHEYNQYQADKLMRILSDKGEDPKDSTF